MHKIKVRAETLTFNLATLLLFVTYCLVMEVICAKLVLNPTMHNKVMGRTRTYFMEVYAQSLKANRDLDLLPSDMVFVCDTSSCHDNYLCKIIFQSHHVRLSNGPDTILERTPPPPHTHRGKTLYALPPFYGGGIKIICRGNKKNNRP